MGRPNERGLFFRLSTLRPSERGLSLEDFFTELWAYALRVQPDLLVAVLRAFGTDLGSDARTIETQAEYPAARIPGCAMPCRPDLRIVGSQGTLLVEHKIDAAQHLESIIDPITGAERLVSQLERYLSLDPSLQLALVARRPTDIAGTVLRDERYLRPVDRAHFVWADLYPLVVEHARAGDPLVRELVRFMDDLDMRPARIGEGVIPSANLPGMEAERRHWARQWDATIDYLRHHGWTCTARGLEITFRRSDSDDVRSPLYLDMRFREKPGRDGHLKARLRFYAESSTPAHELERLAIAAGLESWVERVRSDREPTWDAVMTTPETRSEWIGTGDPGTRLLDFTRIVLPFVHQVLRLTPPRSGARLPPP